MKIKLITLLMLTLVSEICAADCMEGAKAADKFMKSYYVYLQATFNKVVPENSFELWLQENKLVTDKFKTAYKQLEAQAKKDDPELGLDYDPILNSQEYPDNGLQILDCNESGLVTLGNKSKEWQSFKVLANVIKAEKGWLVNGMGAINMPNN